MIDDFVGPESFGAFELLIAARRHPHGCTMQLRDTHRCLRNSPANSPDQDVILVRYACTRHEHSPRSEIRQRERGGRLERNVVWNSPQVLLWNNDIIRECPWCMFAEKSEF